MKQYFLLRDNSTSGPYSLEDFYNMDLFHSDLVWKDDISYSWTFPKDFAELSPLVRVRPKSNARVHAMDKAVVVKKYQNFQEPEIKPLKPVYFKVRSTEEIYQKQIWQKRSMPVASLFNLFLVFIGICYFAFVIKKVVDGFDDGIVMSAERAMQSAKKAQVIEKEFVVKEGGIRK
jgi:hypothetical protein